MCSPSGISLRSLSLGGQSTLSPSTMTGFTFLAGGLRGHFSGSGGLCPASVMFCPRRRCVHSATINRRVLTSVPLSILVLTSMSCCSQIFRKGRSVLCSSKVPPRMKAVVYPRNQGSTSSSMNLWNGTILGCPYNRFAKKASFQRRFRRSGLIVYLKTTKSGGQFCCLWRTRSTQMCNRSSSWS